MILNYILSVDFPNGIYVKGLTSELVASFVAPMHINVDGDADLVEIHYSVDKTMAEQTTIDNVVAAHTGIKAPEPIIHETIMLIATDYQVKNSNDWQDFGGVIVSPQSFDIKKENVKAQVTGQYKIKMGMDAEICLLETGAWNGLPDVDLIQPPHILPGTGDMWLPFTAFSTVEVRDGYWAYVFKSRSKSCDGFYLRYLTLSIVDSGEF